MIKTSGIVNCPVHPTENGKEFPTSRCPGCRPNEKSWLPAYMYPGHPLYWGDKTMKEERKEEYEKTINT